LHYFIDIALGGWGLVFCVNFLNRVDIRKFLENFSLFYIFKKYQLSY
jgi:hypothetical protein